MKLDRNRIAWIAASLVPLALLACDNGIDSVDLDATPPAVHGLSVETSSNELLLRWDFLAEVSPQLSFSGYRVYLKREDESAYKVWTQFHLRPGSATHLPLLQEGNSLSGGRMEVWAVGLTNGILHSFYVTGVQNGNEGPPSAIVSDVPFKLVTNVQIKAESWDGGTYYLIGTSETGGSLTMDRVGYVFDEGTGRHFIRFLPIEEGGRLRMQNAGPGAGKADAPTNGSGAAVGFHNDPSLDRLEIAEGDYVFVWETGGTDETAADDHFARLWIENIVEVPSSRWIKIACAYQSRPNTPNL